MNLQNNEREDILIGQSRSVPADTGQWRKGGQTNVQTKDATQARLRPIDDSVQHGLKQPAVC